MKIHREPWDTINNLRGISCCEEYMGGCAATDYLQTLSLIKF